MIQPQFGKLADAYVKGRRGYPQEIYSLLVQGLGAQATVLDVGCGTGISTRELAEHVEHATGTDSDAQMIEAARSMEGPNIEYNVAPTEALPFPAEQFDLVTAFSAFHWFANTQSIGEVKRVLKTSGVFAVINKNDKNELRKIFHDVVGEFKVVAGTSVKNGTYNPEQLLTDHGFSDIRKQQFTVIEKYRLEDMLVLIQSWNAWSYLSTEQAVIALARIREQYSALVEDGYVNRTIEVTLVTGKK